MAKKGEIRNRKCTLRALGGATQSERESLHKEPIDEARVLDYVKVYTCELGRFHRMAPVILPGACPDVSSNTREIENSAFIVGAVGAVNCRKTENGDCIISMVLSCNLLFSRSLKNVVLWSRSLDVYSIIASMFSSSFLFFL